MVKYIVKIEGMKCKHCEARVDKALKENLDAKNINVSKDNKEAVIISKEELDEAKIEEVVKDTGFEFVSLTKEPYEKKGLFGI